MKTTSFKKTNILLYCIWNSGEQVVDVEKGKLFFDNETRFFFDLGFQRYEERIMHMNFRINRLKKHSLICEPEKKYTRTK
jgi:hypothetical protein